MISGEALEEAKNCQLAAVGQGAGSVGEGATRPQGIFPNEGSWGHPTK